MSGSLERGLLAHKRARLIAMVVVLATTATPARAATQTGLPSWASAEARAYTPTCGDQVAYELGVVDYDLALHKTVVILDGWSQSNIDLYGPAAYHEYWIGVLQTTFALLEQDCSRLSLLGALAPDRAMVAANVAQLQVAIATHVEWAAIVTADPTQAGLGGDVGWQDWWIGNYDAIIATLEPGPVAV